MRCRLCRGPGMSALARLRYLGPHLIRLNQPLLAHPNLNFRSSTQNSDRIELLSVCRPEGKYRLIFVRGPASGHTRQAVTMSDFFLLSDAQMARLEPVLPKSRGKPRIEDRRASGDIMISITMTYGGAIHPPPAAQTRRPTPVAYGKATRRLRFCDGGHNRWTP